MDAEVHGKTLPPVVVFGAGYVGGLVAKQALAAGHRVTALTRNPQKADELRQTGASVIEADVASPDWHASIDGTGAWVLNAVSSGGGGIDGYRRSYRDGMRSILSWAGRGDGVDTLVYTSSTSVYPQGDGAWVDEASPAQPTDEAGQLLRATEDQLMSASPQAVNRWCILRLAGIYGPGRHHLLDQLRAGATEIGGRGEHRLNLIHRDDIAQAVFLAWAGGTKVRNQVFNLADDAASPKAEVVAWLAAQLKRPVPTFSGKPTPGRRATVPDRIIANTKAKAHLMWQPDYPDFRSGFGSLLGA